jgi:hypothetical protein
MVSELHTDGHAVHWVTGTSAPCLSIFKPVLMDAGLPPQGPRPSDRWDATVPWWRHETLHRGAVLGDFSGILADLAPERDALETRFIRHMAEAGPGHRAEAAAACWAEAEAWEASWRRRRLPRGFVTDAGHHLAWQELTAHAKAGASGLRCTAIA